MIKENQKNKSSKDKDKDEILSIVKNSFVRITSGKHSGYYGKVSPTTFLPKLYSKRYWQNRSQLEVIDNHEIITGKHPFIINP